MQIIYLPEVRKFLTQLNPLLGENVYLLIGSLEIAGNALRMPYSKPLGAGLFELRLLGKVQIRILYCFHKGEAYLLYGCIKKSRNLDYKIITLAREMKRLVERL